MVSNARNGGYYVLLDCHWSGAGVWGQNMAQQMMPDTNTSTFWGSCAARYANNTAVLFDLYNEPHDVSWSVWRNGGSVSDGGLNYNTPGLQGLLNTIRGTRANKIVVAGGLTSAKARGPPQQSRCKQRWHVCQIECFWLDENGRAVPSRNPNPFASSRSSQTIAC